MSRDDNFADLAIPDMQRRVSNMFREGTISKIDTKKGLVRVKSGSLESNWIPWLEVRHGKNQSWNPPDIGEQVLIAAPSGDLSQGMVIGSSSQDKHPAPSDDGDVTVMMNWGDGSRMEYNRKTHDFKLTVGGTLFQVTNNTIKAKASTIDLQADTILMSGEVTHSNGTFKSNDVSVHKHNHIGDSGGLTQKPNAGT